MTALITKRLGPFDPLGRALLYKVSCEIKPSCAGKPKADVSQTRKVEDNV
jgi:hypothetical protein